MFGDQVTWTVNDSVGHCLHGESSCGVEKFVTWKLPVHLSHVFTFCWVLPVSPFCGHFTNVHGCLRYIWYEADIICLYIYIRMTYWQTYSMHWVQFHLTGFQGSHRKLYWQMSVIFATQGSSWKDMSSFVGNSSLKQNEKLFCESVVNVNNSKYIYQGCWN